MSSFDSRRGLFRLRARGACVIRLAAVRLETPDHPLLGTITSFFKTSSGDRRSSFDSRRGLFRLRARGACVIRLAAVRLETPDHPLLGTISSHSFNSLCRTQLAFNSRRGLVQRHGRGTCEIRFIDRSTTRKLPNRSRRQQRPENNQSACDDCLVGY